MRLHLIYDPSLAEVATGPKSGGRLQIRREKKKTKKKMKRCIFAIKKCTNKEEHTVLSFSFFFPLFALSANPPTPVVLFSISPKRG